MNLKTLCQVKKARHKRAHTYLYDFIYMIYLEKANLEKQEIRLVVNRGWK